MASVFVLITLPVDKEATVTPPDDKTGENATVSNVTKDTQPDPSTVIASDEPDNSKSPVSPLVSKVEDGVLGNTESESDQVIVGGDSTPCEIIEENTEDQLDFNQTVNIESRDKTTELTVGESVSEGKGSDQDTECKTESETRASPDGSLTDMTDKDKTVRFTLGSHVDEDQLTKPEFVDSLSDKSKADDHDGKMGDEKNVVTPGGLDRGMSVEDYGGAIKLTPQIIKDCLMSHKVEDAFWRTSVDGQLMQVNFMIEYGMGCEKILQSLMELGVGCVNRSSISMFPATYFSKAEDSDEEQDDMEETETEGSLDEFRKSIKSRLLVAEVVESVKSNSRLTFDYIILIVLASVIACMGLVENSSVVLVASMLISPLMGPIMAGTFGIVIKNGELKWIGIRNELIGLLLCLACGVLSGLVTGGVALHEGHWGSVQEWPTSEMKSRGQSRSLWVGIFIALPSGAGVAFSILGGNAGSLVGVAISASLLPPAVNAGMLWAYSILSAISPPDVIQNGTVVGGPGLSCPPFRQNGYSPVYSCNMAAETVLLGLISLLLTILNILCIFVMSIVVLKIKEVAPHTAKSAADHSFWKKDIRVARQSYTTLKGPSGANLKKQFLEEYAKVTSKHGKQKSSSDAAYQVKAMVERVTNSPEVKDVTCRLMNNPALKFNWSSEDVSPVPGFPDVYKTVRHRHRHNSDMYQTIHSYSGHTKVTHKVLKRTTEDSVKQVSETLPKKKGTSLKVTIPEMRIRKSSDANISRTFLITAVEEVTDGEKADLPDQIMAAPSTTDTCSSEADRLLQPV